MVTVDLVIFPCLNFIKQILSKFRIREFQFFISANIIIFGRLMNSQICPPCEFRENKDLANMTIPTYLPSSRWEPTIEKHL